MTSYWKVMIFFWFDVSFRCQLIILLSFAPTTIFGWLLYPNQPKKIGTVHASNLVLRDVDEYVVLAPNMSQSPDTKELVIFNKVQVPLITAGQFWRDVKHDPSSRLQIYPQKTFSETIRHRWYLRIILVSRGWLNSQASTNGQHGL